MELNYDNLYEIMEDYLPHHQIENVHKAYLFTKSAHEDQFRKSGEPYIIHPIAVTTILAKQKLPMKVLIAGLLHDVVEDTEIQEDEIVELFGEDVASIVDGVTKLGNIEGMNKDQVQAANHRKILLATAKDVRVMLVKLADRVHNMQTIKYMNESKQKVIANETLEVYAPIAHRLGMYNMKWELEDLALKCINHEAFEEIKESLNMKRSEREEIVNEIEENVQELLSAKNLEAKIYGRTKSIYSIYQKMRKTGKDFDEIQDLFAFRIVVDDVATCYSSLGIIHHNYKPIPMRFKDYIPTPKHNMYQSIHTTVLTKSGFPIEFQIRTNEMEEEAEYGVAAHWRYKEDIEEDDIHDHVQSRLEWLRRAAEQGNSDVNNADFMKYVKGDFLSKSIIVYTPTGDVIEIAEGATVLDFAYHIHTDIGNQAVSGKINNKIVSLFYPLELGDVVTVVTSDIAEPSISYISKVTTSRAREKLKDYFKSVEKDQIKHEGKKNIEKYLKKTNNTTNFESFYDSAKFQEYLRYLDLENREQFFYQIGIGTISIVSTIRYFNEEQSEEVSTTDVDINNLKEKYNTKICKFCTPIPGDRIFASKNINSVNKNEYYIHRTNCPENLDKLESHWTSFAENNLYMIRFNCEVKDEPGSLVNVLSIIGEKELSLISVYFGASFDGTSEGRITIEVKSREEYKQLKEKLMNNQDIISIHRAIEIGDGK